MGGFCGRLNEGRIRDSLLEVEERETDAVLDENGEVLGFHHDRPANENGLFSSQEKGHRGAFLGNIPLWGPLERRHRPRAYGSKGERQRQGRGDDTLR